MRSLSIAAEVADWKVKGGAVVELLEAIRAGPHHRIDQGHRHHEGALQGHAETCGSVRRRSKGVAATVPAYDPPE